MGSVPLLIYVIILGYPAKIAILIYQILTKDRQNSGKPVASLGLALESEGSEIGSPSHDAWYRPRRSALVLACIFRGEFVESLCHLRRSASTVLPLHSRWPWWPAILNMASQLVFGGISSSSPSSMKVSR